MSAKNLTLSDFFGVELTNDCLDKVCKSYVNGVFTLALARTPGELMQSFLKLGFVAENSEYFISDEQVVEKVNSSKMFTSSRELIVDILSLQLNGIIFSSQTSDKYIKLYRKRLESYSQEIAIPNIGSEFNLADDIDQEKDMMNILKTEAGAGSETLYILKEKIRCIVIVLSDNKCDDLAGNECEKFGIWLKYVVKLTIEVINHTFDEEEYKMCLRFFFVKLALEKEKKDQNTGNVKLQVKLLHEISGDYLDFYVWFKHIVFEVLVNLNRETELEVARRSRVKKQRARRAQLAIRDTKVRRNLFHNASRNEVCGPQ